MARLPLYKMIIDDEAEGMDFMGLVDIPAHGKSWVALSKLPQKVELKYHFNEEKRIVRGVAIATDLQIYRRDPDGYEYNIVFTKEEVSKLIKKFAKNNYFNNVNLMHDMELKQEGVYMTEMFTINDEMSNVPKEFQGQNLRPGSLIMSYWVENDKTWQFVKENGTGFSIEGWFGQQEIKLNKKKKMSLLEKLGLKKEADKTVFDSENKEKYMEATTLDGQVIMWEGELEAGKPLFIVPEDGSEPILAADGTYPVEMDGASWVITVDEAGMIEAIEAAEEMKEDEEEKKEEEEMSEIEEALQAMKADYDNKFEEFKKEILEKIGLMASHIDASEIQKQEKEAGKVVNTAKPKKKGWKALKK